MKKLITVYYIFILTCRDGFSFLGEIFFLESDGYFLFLIEL